jgi:hypothetical protein
MFQHGHTRGPRGAVARVAGGVLAFLATALPGGCVHRVPEGTLGSGPDRPAVTIGFGATEFTVSIAVLRKGIDIPVTVTAGAEAEGLSSVPLDAGGCAPADSNGLRLFPVVLAGEEVVYCPACDVGPCPAATNEPSAPAKIKAGQHHYKFVWRGEASRGSSDMAGGLRPARLVGPGTYELVVQLALASAGEGNTLGPVRLATSSRHTIRVIGGEAPGAAPAR